MKRFLRIITSNITVSFLFIVMELFLLGLFIYYASSYYYIVYISSVVVNALVIVNLMNREANPEFKISWLVVVIFLPFFGTILYLIFYKRRLTNKEKVLWGRIESELSANDRGLEALSELGATYPHGAAEALSIMKDDGTSALYNKSRINYFPSGEEYYESLLRDLAEAKCYIMLEYFIIAEGAMWDGIYKILSEKLTLGVTVMIIYDDVGSMGLLPKGDLKHLSDMGAFVLPFGRVTPRISPAHNNRDHRKIGVIDGTVAYTGGVNIADEYINEKKRFGHWKDGGVRLSGDGAMGFVRMFLSSFVFCGGALPGKLPEAIDPPIMSDGGYYLPFCDGPLPTPTAYGGKCAIMNLINSSAETLYITTPYLVIDYSITEALLAAAKRGVDVRIITPGIPDKKTVKIMTKSSYRYLIDAGVEIYEYTPGFIHEKLLVSDGKYAVVGTINFDYRSLVHHYENAVFMAYTDTVKKAHDGFIKNVAESCRIERSAARLSLVEKIFKIGIRVFAPLL